MSPSLSEMLRGRADIARHTHPAEAELDDRAADVIDRLTATIERVREWRSEWLGGCWDCSPDDLCEWCSLGAAIEGGETP